MTGPTPTMSMVSACPARPGWSHSTSAPIAEMLRSRISRAFAVDRGDRAAHQALARLADALEAVGLDGGAVGQLARRLGVGSGGRRCSPGLADAELADQLEIVVGLDALGGGVHAQAFGEGDDGADDRAVAVGGRGGAADEALVDLDLVERRLLQIAERASSRCRNRRAPAGRRAPSAWRRSRRSRRRRQGTRPR